VLGLQVRKWVNSGSAKRKCWCSRGKRKIKEKWGEKVWFLLALVGGGYIYIRRGGEESKGKKGGVMGFNSHEKLRGWERVLGKRGKKR